MVGGKCVKVYLALKWVGENGREFKKYIVINLPMYGNKKKKIQFGRIYVKKTPLTLLSCQYVPGFVLRASFTCCIQFSQTNLVEINIMSYR